MIVNYCRRSVQALMVPTDAKATVETLSQTISFAFLSLIPYATSSPDIAFLGWFGP
jgi:hypothetical protein